MGKIILTGYMGSGKSTVAALLHQKTGLKWMDLDELIEKKAGLRVSEIFRAKGEIYFRKLEHNLFKELMQSGDNFILSLGGGTPCYANNHELLSGEHVISVYLKASVGELYNRLVANKENRPLVAGKSPEEMQEFIAKHLFDRSFFYNHAGFKINTDHKTPEAVASEIVEQLA